MVCPRKRRGAALLIAAAGVVGCTTSPRPETAPAPQPSPIDSAAIDTLRGRESGSAGYVIPARFDPRKHGPRRFYTGKNYGSEAEFNPLTEFLNEGFDVLSLAHADRHIFAKNYGVDARNVLNSVFHPIQSFSDYGWKNLFKAEIFPTSLTRTRTSGKWISNYQLHMFGSGMVSLRMTDWYELHGYDHAALLGQLTTLAAHYMNEVSENGDMKTPNEDPVVDLLLFDGAGFALWHQHWMQRAFTGKYHLTNWPGQPSATIPSIERWRTRASFVARAVSPREDVGLLLRDGHVRLDRRVEDDWRGWAFCTRMGSTACPRSRRPTARRA